VILERTRHDFGGRGRAAVDQHDERLALGEIAGARIEPLRFLGVAAARRRNLALLQEGIRDRNRLIQGAFSIRYCNAAPWRSVIFAFGQRWYAAKSLPPRLRDAPASTASITRSPESDFGMSALSSFGSGRDVGLRAGLLVALGLEVSAQRSLTARVGARLELLRHLLQHFDIGRDSLRLDRRLTGDRG
jgi:hypothetical protein